MDLYLSEGLFRAKQKAKEYTLWLMDHTILATSMITKPKVLESFILSNLSIKEISKITLLRVRAHRKVWFINFRANITRASNQKEFINGEISKTTSINIQVNSIPKIFSTVEVIIC